MNFLAPLKDLKEFVDVAKGAFEILGFLLVGLYFLYRLLAGFFTPCRLSLTLSCDATSFTDKSLVKATVKLKNTGPASVRITDARFWAFRLERESLHPKVRKRIWDQLEELPADRLAGDLARDELDFQRLSVDLDTGKLILRLAEEEHGWLNLETQGEQQREFAVRLPPGLYKLEFRLMGIPMFGRDTQFARNISHKLFPLSRYSQWVATAIVEVVSSASWWHDSSGA